jgi:DNA-binding transcriptional LysR family regulator
MKEPPLDRIAAFDAVMETGSLSGAARRLRLSQPTIRAQIAGLEDDLGQVLFTRTTAGLVPTDRARDLGERARAVRQAALAFARAATGAADAVAGRVRITASRVFAAEILPGVLAPLLAGVAGLTIEIAATDRVEDLGAQDADIAIRLAEPRQAALVARRLRPVTIGVHAAPALLARTGPPQDAADLLARRPVVTEDRGRAIADALAAQGLRPPAHVALATDDDLVQVAAIAAGLGFGFCQAGVGAARGLTRVLPDFAANLPVWAVMHEDLRREARVRAVFDHLTRALA